MPSRRSDGHRRWNNWDGDGMAVAIVWAVCIQEIVQWLFQSRCKVDSCAKTFNVRWPLCQGEIILLTLFFVLFFSFHMHLLAVCIIYMCLALDQQSQPMFSGIPVICVVISRTLFLHLWGQNLDAVKCNIKKLARTWLPSIGFQSWSWFLAVSLQLTWIINPAVGCHNFPPGLQFCYIYRLQQTLS